MKKREWGNFQNWLIDEHGNSAARVRRIKATISSLSKYIIDILFLFSYHINMALTFTIISKYNKNMIKLIIS